MEKKFVVKNEMQIERERTGFIAWVLFVFLRFAEEV